ncbi:MAG: hypothetical protein QOI21_1076 [Actinomycetota bacterium]|jgi:hypothetical protein|nr:hypothetical protein [Actinomycetota bacterium]
MLSHHDRDALDRIAQQLEESDPALAAALRNGKVSGLPGMKTFLLAVLALLGALLGVLGIAAASMSVLMLGLVTLSAAATIYGVRRMGNGGKEHKGRRARPAV